MVQPRQDLDLLLNGVQVVIELRLVHHLDGHDVLLVMLVVRFEHFAECAGAQHVRVRVYLVVMLQFLRALLLRRFQRDLLLFSEDVGSLSATLCRIRWSHFFKI